MIRKRPYVCFKVSCMVEIIHIARVSRWSPIMDGCGVRGGMIRGGLEPGTYMIPPWYGGKEVGW